MGEKKASIRSLGIGLSLVYAGLCLLFVSGAVFGVSLTGIVHPAFVVVGLGLILFAVLCDIVGRLMCLAVPSEWTQARTIVFISVSCSAVGFACAVVSLMDRKLEMEAIPRIETWLGPLFSVVGSTIFVVFLRSVARQVGRPRLVMLASTVLILGMVLVLGALLLAGLSMAYPEIRKRELLGMIKEASVYALIASALAIVICYGNLLTYLRTAVFTAAAQETSSLPD